MQTKVCYNCYAVLPIAHFGIKKKDGLPNSWCKKCVSDKTLAYKRTPVGITVQMYKFQKSSSLRRNHPAPNYTREWFTQWVLSQPNFQQLFKAWESSGWDKYKVPSVDRLNDNLPYTEDNIQLMSWGANDRKGMRCYREGKIGIQVDQLTTDGAYIKTFTSVALAAETVGCSMGEISRVCRGGRKTCHNFKWRYTIEHNVHK